MRKIISIVIMSLLISHYSYAQLTVTASISGTATNDNSSCDDRVITTTVSGGSGNYMYMYSKNAGEPGPDLISTNTATYTVDPQPIVKTDYRVVAIDLATGLSASTLVTGIPKPSNNFNNPFMSNVFTPNNDGINDIFYPILSQNKDIEELAGVYKASLYVFYSDGLPILDLVVEPTNQVDHPIKYKDIYWNGKVANTGNILYDGTYYYVLKLYNCDYPNGKEYTSYVTLLR